MLLCIEQHDLVGGIKNKTVCVETHREKISFKNAHLIHHRKIEAHLYVMLNHQTSEVELSPNMII